MKLSLSIILLTANASHVNQLVSNNLKAFSFENRGTAVDANGIRVGDFHISNCGPSTCCECNDCCDCPCAEKGSTSTPATRALSRMKVQAEEA